MVVSVHMIQLGNHCMDWDEVWYGHYAMGAYPEILSFNFLQSVIPKLGGT
jgi:hypothetical protein